MAGDVEAEQFLFELQQVLAGEFVDVGKDVGRARGRRCFGRRGEHQRLAGTFVVLILLAGFEGAFEYLEERGALRADAGEGAAFDQRFDGGALHRARVHALAEIVDASERARLFALGDDAFNGFFTDAFDGAHAEANRVLPAR